MWKLETMASKKSPHSRAPAPTPGKQDVLEVGDLKFDEENPRLPESTKGEPQIVTWLLDHANVVELMHSIGSLGYFDGEPLLVVPHAVHRGKYVVIEGNRRLAALKLLSSPEDAPIRSQAVEEAAKEADFHPKKVPCLVFNERDHILGYLGHRHVVGIKQWDSLAKARYLQQLADRLGPPLNASKTKALAKQIGSKKDYVEKLLTGLALLKTAIKLQLPGRNDVPRISELDFSLLTTALSFQKITAFLGMKERLDLALKGLEEKRFRELFRWIYSRSGEKGTTPLGESRNLAVLAKVVADEDALKRFRNGWSLQAAFASIGGGVEPYREAMRRSIEALQVAEEMIRQVDTFDQNDQEQVDRAFDLAAALKRKVEGAPPKGQGKK